MSVPGPVIQDLYTGRHAAPIAVTLGASPATFQAPSRGYLALTAGTISSVTLTRGPTSSPTTITLPANTIYPMSNGDILTVTYSVIPTGAEFVPH